MVQTIIPDVIGKQSLKTVNKDATAREAARIMGSNKISAILVVENQHLEGIITERDLTAKVLANGLDPDVTVVETIMTPDPDTITHDDTPNSALGLMSSRGYRHLPVLEGDRIAGIVSIRDLYSFVKKNLYNKTVSGFEVI